MELDEKNLPPGGKPRIKSGFCEDLDSLREQYLSLPQNMHASLDRLLDEEGNFLIKSAIVQNCPLKMIMVPSIGFFFVAERQNIY